MTLIVFHGVESVGKTTLARDMAAFFGAEFLPEFGRSFCEIHGTDCSLEDLLDIGERQQRNIEIALAENDLVISDTDALMTAAWARMMHGAELEPLMAARKADLYFHCAADRPFVHDGVRVYGDPADRARFDMIARNVLSDANVSPVMLSGDWSARRLTAISAIRHLLGEGATLPSV